VIRLSQPRAALVGEYGLITLHRPANVDDPEMLDRLLEALEAVARDLPLVFPVHRGHGRGSRSGPVRGRSG
jgi:UDP-N-acetylglucosamine 2-epimerase (non-hydrolysing)